MSSSFIQGWAPQLASVSWDWLQLPPPPNPPLFDPDKDKPVSDNGRMVTAQ